MLYRNNGLPLLSQLRSGFLGGADLQSSADCPIGSSRECRQATGRGAAFGPPPPRYRSEDRGAVSSRKTSATMVGVRSGGNCSGRASISPVARGQAYEGHWASGENSGQAAQNDVSGQIRAKPARPYEPPVRQCCRLTGLR